MLFTMFMQRMGLDSYEAEEVNELTSIAQMAQDDGSIDEPLMEIIRDTCK